MTDTKKECPQYPANEGLTMPGDPAVVVTDRGHPSGEATREESAPMPTQVGQASNSTGDDVQASIAKDDGTADKEKKEKRQKDRLAKLMAQKTPNTANMSDAEKEKYWTDVWQSVVDGKFDPKGLEKGFNFVSRQILIQELINRGHIKDKSDLNPAPRVQPKPSIRVKIIFKYRDNDEPLSYEHVKYVKEKLTRFCFDEMKQLDKKIYLFEDYGFYNDHFAVIAATEETVAWTLQQEIPPLNGVKFMSTKAQLSRKNKIIVKCQYDIKLKPHEVKRQLSIENPHLGVEGWILATKTFPQHSKALIFLVDEKTTQFLERMRWKVILEGEKVPVFPLQKKKSKQNKGGNVRKPGGQNRKQDVPNASKPTAQDSKSSEEAKKNPADGQSSQNEETNQSEKNDPKNAVTEAKKEQPQSSNMEKPNSEPPQKEVKAPVKVDNQPKISQTVNQRGNSTRGNTRPQGIQRNQGQAGGVKNQGQGGGGGVRNQGRGGARTQGQGPTRTPGQGPTRTPGQGPTRNQGQGPPARNPGQGPTRNPGQGPTRNPGQGPIRNQGQNRNAGIENQGGRDRAYVRPQWSSSGPGGGVDPFLDNRNTGGAWTTRRNPNIEPASIIESPSSYRTAELQPRTSYPDSQSDIRGLMSEHFGKPAADFFASSSRSNMGSSASEFFGKSRVNPDVERVTKFSDFASPQAEGFSSSTRYASDVSHGRFISSQSDERYSSYTNRPDTFSRDRSPLRRVEEEPRLRLRDSVGDPQSRYEQDYDRSDRARGNFLRSSTPETDSFNNRFISSDRKQNYGSYDIRSDNTLGSRRPEPAGGYDSSRFDISGISRNESMTGRSSDRTRDYSGRMESDYLAARREEGVLVKEREEDLWRRDGGNQLRSSGVGREERERGYQDAPSSARSEVWRDSAPQRSSQPLSAGYSDQRYSTPYDNNSGGGSKLDPWGGARTNWPNTRY